VVAFDCFVVSSGTANFSFASHIAFVAVEHRRSFPGFLHSLIIMDQYVFLFYVRMDG